MKQKWVPLPIETVHRDRPGRGRGRFTRPWGGRWADSHGRSGRRNFDDGPRSDKGTLFAAVPAYLVIVFSYQRKVYVACSRDFIICYNM